MSVYFYKGEISLAWVDMTAGVVKLEHIGGKNFLQDFTESIQKIEPGEIIISEGIKNSKILKEELRNFDKQISIIPEAFYDFKNNEEIIKKFFGNKKIQSFGDLSEINIAAVGAVINYLKLTQKNNIPKIRSIEKVSKDNSMQIDMFTLRSLEIFERYDGIKRGSLIDTIDKTKTACGARMLRLFLKAPLMKKSEIKYRHNLIESFLYNFRILEEITKLLSNIPDLERALARITAKTNNPRDLILVKQFVSFTEQIFLRLNNLKEKNLKELIPDKKILSKAYKTKKIIDDVIAETPPVNLNEGGVINDSVNTRLDELRNLKQIKKEEIINLQENMVLQPI